MPKVDVMVWKLFSMGILLPAAASGAVLLIPYSLWRRLPSSLTPAALCLGYAAGYSGVAGVPSLPPLDASQWTVYIVSFAAVASMADALFAFQRKVDYLFMTFFSFGISYAFLRPLMQYRWNGAEGVLWIAGTGVFILALWFLMKRSAEASGAPSALSVALVIITFSGFILLLSGSALLGQLAGAFAAAFLPVTIAALLSPSAGIYRKVVPVIVAAFASLWINGYFFAEMSAWSIAFLFFALCAAFMGKVGWVGRLSPLRQALITGAAAAIPSCIALAIAAFLYI